MNHATPQEASAKSPPMAIGVMAKPSGAVCNLDCSYCFYLEKTELYPEGRKDWRMDADTLELYTAQYIKAQDVPQVDFAWQGGEPTLLGLDFFRKALALQVEYADGKTITNSLQTNGTLLDDEWGELLARHGFLVGLSIDGPREMHDAYRRDRGGRSSFDKVMSGLATLKKHGVEFNTLTALHNRNVGHPLQVYRFLKQIGSRFTQFIPVVERAAVGPGRSLSVGPEYAGPARIRSWSVGAREYGKFLCDVFDEWVRQDVGRQYVQIFEATLAGWAGYPSGLCIHAETCGRALVIEHNGDVYSCDHFVYPEYRLGNVRESTIRQMASSPTQEKFGQNKREQLPGYCRKCGFRFACHGGCPKLRFARTPTGEDGLNTLCEGYRAYFAHVEPYMQFMCASLRKGQPAASVMNWAGHRAQRTTTPSSKPGRNAPCPCGKDRKYKQCCGRAG